MIEDAYDRRLALGATGLLAALNRSEVLAAADVHVAQRVAAIAGEDDADVLLAAALAVRAVRQGATALSLAEPPEGPPDQPAIAWPEPVAWLDAVRRSRLVAAGVLRVDLDLVYLDRYWREEVQVRDDLVARLERTAPETDAGALAAGALRVFPRDGYDEQRAAATAAASRSTTILTGGPGTGKTATVAGILALLAEQHTRSGSERALRIGLCAPTGKAAARLQESVRAELATFPDPDRARLTGLRATTLHRLLGWRRGSSVRFRHDRAHRLPHDVVVVDETSMVSLTMMARLLEAVRPGARLVLVGDQDQLASVEAGAVLTDLVGGLRARSDSPVVELVTPHRYRGAIADLAQALRDCDADRVVEILRDGGDEVGLVDPDDAAARAAFEARVVDASYATTLAAEAGDAAEALASVDRHRLLCAHREGAHGVGGWNRLVARGVAERTGVTHYEEWYAGRPVLVTANDPTQGLYNGDVGVTVRDLDDPGRLRVVLPDADGPRRLAPTRLPEVSTMYAMTVHKSQGSQALDVSVVLPPDDSRLLTHELFYTAVTRAQERVRVLGSETAVRAAVERRVRRASGLATRLS